MTFRKISNTSFIFYLRKKIAPREENFEQIINE